MGRGKKEEESRSKISWWREGAEAFLADRGKEARATEGQGADLVSGRPWKGTRRWAWG